MKWRYHTRNQKIPERSYMDHWNSTANTTQHMKNHIRYGVPYCVGADFSYILISDIQCCGSGMVIPDPESEFFPSRIRIFSIPDPGSASNNSSILTPKNWFLSSRKCDRGCSSRIRIPDPRSRGQKGSGSRISDPDPQHC